MSQVPLLAAAAVTPETVNGNLAGIGNPNRNGLRLGSLRNVEGQRATARLGDGLRGQMQQDRNLLVVGGKRRTADDDGGVVIGGSHAAGRRGLDRGYVGTVACVRRSGSGQPGGAADFGSDGTIRGESRGSGAAGSEIEDEIAWNIAAQLRGDVNGLRRIDGIGIGQGDDAGVSSRCE